MKKDGLLLEEIIRGKRMFKTIITFLLFTFTVWSCPFDEAGIEVTIVAYNDISKAVKSEDFEKVSSEITKQKELYEYFEKADKKPLYVPLLNASKQKDAVKVKKLLDHSLVLEIKELLNQVEDNFDKYQNSRLLLIKAKKHLKVLTKDKKATKMMKVILKSIGNPGLMGMGKRDADKVLFDKHKKLLIGQIS